MPSSTDVGITPERVTTGRETALPATRAMHQEKTAPYWGPSGQGD